MFQIHSKEIWMSKTMKKLGFDFTEQEIYNDINGYIGERMGIKCYLNELIPVAKY